MRIRNLTAILPALALLAACQQQQGAGEPTVHAIMKNKIDANADALWDLTNPALNNDATLNPAKIDDARWAQIAQRAQAVADAAGELASLKTLKLVEPGQKIADQDLVGGDPPDAVQANLDRNPTDFRQFAGALQAHMNDVVAYAKAHDARKLSPLIDQLDGVCENCHLEFWYPDQKAYIEKIRKSGGNDPTS
jgi:cytochrome c556